MRSVLALSPVTAALSEQLFGRMHQRQVELLKQLVQELVDRVTYLESKHRLLLREEFFDTDEFRYLLRGVLERASKEHREVKRIALRGMLLNSMATDPRHDFNMKVFFLEVLDVVSAEHVMILEHLHSQSVGAVEPQFVKVADLWTAFQATEDSMRSYLYSGLDTLANRQLLHVGPIPMKSDQPTLGWNRQNLDLQHYTIEKAEQSYALSALGKEFLAFISEPGSTIAN